MKGRQGRFLAATIGGWIAARSWLLWPAAPIAIGSAMLTAGLVDGSGGAPRFSAAASFQPMRVPSVVARRVAGVVAKPTAEAAPVLAFTVEQARRDDALLLAFDSGFGTGPQRLLRRAAFADRAPAPPTAPVERPAASAAHGGRAIEGQAYLFVRPGSGRAALAPGGSLGGSQAAVRFALALNRTGPVRLAVAARVYAPLETKGAEAAVGLDWHPVPNVPLRFSIERRIGLDHAGRDAWSAYAAGGFYAGHLPLGLEADGYAQAGVVGARRRDLFANAALRAGRRVALGPAEVVIGAGSWGAAQPGAARLDVGPRIALSLPVEHHRLTLAIEGRLRVAGRAAPGSGAAVTLAADF